ncbi:methyl-accepting chemotaxis protein [Paenibacillus wynnii]|uniref:methyl-accepting chemotaxis protein n=1 Tax=Paenibacillus wynnii TaxID=268407 RepID=UPI002790639F|nr:methyl-accepting chemotaxis protein [Paenibacillus wynnii]MDQ0193512.1 methyl-accepting chemotaxis protein [Paenibacillus wynnii]
MSAFILKPFIAVISRLKYAQKFILLSLLFVGPLVFLLSIWLSNIQQNIEIAEKEKVGVSYIESLMPLMLNIQQHRGLANGYLNGDTTSESKLVETEKKINSNIELIGKTKAKNIVELDSTDLWTLIQSDWKKLQATTTSLRPEDSFNQHSALIHNVLGLITLAADQSGLTLDPEIDSFYLMDMMVNRLPILIELTGQARGQGNGILARKQITTDEKISLMIDKNQIENALQGIEQAVIKATKYNTSFDKQFGDTSKLNVESVNRFIQALDTNILNTSAISMTPADYFAEGTKAIDDSVSLFKVVSAELSQLLDVRIDNLSSNRNNMLLIIGISLLLVGLFYTAFYRNVKSTIQSLQVGAAKLAAGDLSERLKLQTKDELSYVGDSFNLMADSLNDLLRRNQEISEQVAASSQQLSAVSVESTTVMKQIAYSVSAISDGAEVQQKASEENALAMKEMAVAITRIAESASEVSDSASDATNGAKLGEKKLQDSFIQMNLIQEAVGQSSQFVTKLNEHSDEIHSIVSMIMGISSQTHLLSLNANIEAARAGEQGRGFMVVATEVGKLAERTTQSAMSIAALVDEVRTLVARVVASMEQTALVTEQGLETNKEAVQAIGIILNSIQLVADQIQDVSASAEQVSAGTEQVTAAFTEMVDISKQTADESRNMAAAAEEQLSSMEEVQASSEMLSASAQQLQDELGRFNLLER